MSPTQRAMRDLKKLGYTGQIVEYTVRIPGRTFKRDLFGIIDIVALTPSGILGLQVCAGASHSARRAKMLAEPRASSWVNSGGLLELWSYSKRGAKGKRKTWTQRVETWLQMQEAE